MKLNRNIPPIVADTSEPKDRGPLALRFSLAVLVGLLVACLSLLAVWADMRKAESVRSEQSITRVKLNLVAEVIKAYRSDHQALPQSMIQLRESDVWDNLNRDHYLFDGWGRPFILSVDGTNWTVLSYGWDGKPGGTGANADLTNWNPKPVESKELPSLYEFVVQSKVTHAATTTTIVSGLLAAAVCFFTVSIPKLTRQSLAKTVPRVLGILIGAGLVAWFIAGLEVPHH